MRVLREGSAAVSDRAGARTNTAPVRGATMHAVRYVFGWALTMIPAEGVRSIVAAQVGAETGGNLWRDPCGAVEDGARQ